MSVRAAHPFVELRKPATRSQLLRAGRDQPLPAGAQRLEELADGAEPCLLSPMECLQEHPGCVMTGGNCWSSSNR